MTQNESIHNRLSGLENMLGEQKEEIGFLRKRMQVQEEMMRERDVELEASKGDVAQLMEMAQATGKWINTAWEERNAQRLAKRSKDGVLTKKGKWEWQVSSVDRITRRERRTLTALDSPSTIAREHSRASRSNFRS